MLNLVCITQIAAVCNQHAHTSDECAARAIYAIISCLQTMYLLMPTTLKLVEHCCQVSLTLVPGPPGVQSQLQPAEPEVLQYSVCHLQCKAHATTACT